jgi:hypothetical protein
MSALEERRATLALYLAALAGSDRTGFIEIRSKRDGGGMHQQFHRTTRLRPAVDLIIAMGQRTDVYVGQAPRTHRHGGKDAIDLVHGLWVDCDEPAAVHALSAFDPTPSIIVRSGGITADTPHCHAYWQLRQPLKGEHAEAANRRLQHALGADPKCVEMARVLRPPGTLSHKHGGRPVECVRIEPTSFTAREIVGDLPDPPDSKWKEHLPNRQRVADLTRTLNTNDPLHAIPSREYIPALLGVELSRDSKVSCPWHGRDSNPSLHCYDGDGGWCCYGCEPRRGGDIISFGSYLYGIEARGKGFFDIRRRLAADLLGSIEAAA